MFHHASEIKHCRMVWGYRDSTGAFRAHTRIADAVHFNHPEGIQIGDHVYIGPYSILDGTGGLVIETGCQIGPWVGLFTHSSHIAIRLYGSHFTDIPETDKKGFIVRPLRIGKYTFIGAATQVFPGGSIGHGAYIAPHSTIRQMVPDFAMIEGNGRIVGDTRDLDKRYLTDPQIRLWYEEWQKDEASPAKEIAPFPYPQVM